MPFQFKKFIFVSVCLLLWVASASYAQNNTIVANPSLTSFDISANILIYHDTNGDETIETIKNISDWETNFTTETPITEKGVWWLKFTFVNNSGFNPLLKIVTDEATLYQQLENGAVAAQHNSFTTPANQKVFHTHSPFEQFFELDKSTRPTTYLLRFNSVFPGTIQYVIKPEISDPDVLNQRNNTRRDQFYFFMGIILLALFYGVFQLSSNRKATEFYFLFFVLCALPTVMQRFGFWYFHIYEYSKFLANNSHFILQVITMFPIILFTREFLELKQKMPKVHRWLGWLLVSIAISTFMGFLVEMRVHFATKMINSALAIGIISLVIYSNLALFKRGEKYIRFILVGYVLGAITVAFMLTILFTSSQARIDWPSVGYTLIVLFYLLAIVDRMNFEKAEKQRILVEQNVTLEKQVKVKTRKVSEQNERLAKQNNKLEQQNKIILEEKEKLEATTRHLKETQSELIVKEKMASLGQLTAGIAHEIKNPLNFINNFADISCDLVEQVKEELDAYKNTLPNSGLKEVTESLNHLSANASKISEHGKRADVIVQSMLRHTVAGSGKKEKADLANLIENGIVMALRNFRSVQPGFSLKPMVDVEDTLPTANLLVREITNVLVNILVNSFYALMEKYGIEGMNQKGKCELFASSSNDRIKIVVKDNGCGISQENLGRVFTPFFTTKPTGQGNTGLGLSLSYDMIVKDHAGKIEIESEDGQFTVVTIELPV